jgi:hypothetical protein
MALTLIKETGAGLANANAYANAADGDAYHEGHLYATAWTAASAANKDAALVMATRLIDGQYQFAGWKTSVAQALQWPRASCLDPDGEDDLPVDAVPKAVIAATCELARELLIADHTAAPAGEGLKYQNIGTTQTGYSKDDTRPIISHVTQALLAKFGSLLKSKSGAVRLVRA